MVVWSQLNAFLMVAACNSITRAAENLGYTPSAVSQQVRKLEAQLKHTLIERHSRGIRLTEAGRIVAQHAERIDIQLSSMDSALEDLSGLRAGSLSMATFPTAAATIVGSAVAAFRKTYPDVHINLRSDFLSSVLPMLLKRDVGLAVVWQYPAVPWQATEIDRMKLGDDRAVLVVPKFHELASLDEVHISRLQGEAWVSRGEGHPTSELIQRLAEGSGFSPRVVFNANSYQEAHALVAAGLGITVTPRLGLSAIRRDVIAIPLVGDGCYRELFIARLADRELTPPEHAMVEVLHTVSSDVLSTERVADSRPEGIHE